MQVRSAKHDGPYRHRGYAALGVTFLLMGSLLSIVLGYSALMSRDAANTFEDTQKAYLSNIKLQIENWYQRNSALIDADVAPPAVSTVLNGAGVTAQWNLQVSISNRITNGDISYRVIALWIPQSDSDTSALDVNTGMFTPAAGTKYSIVDGAVVEAKAASETLAAMKFIAGKLEDRFNAKFIADGGNNITANWFRPLDSGCLAQPDEIPCTDSGSGGYQDASALALDKRIGVSPTMLFNAWGYPVEICNAAVCSNISAPPYTTVVRSPTPWGANLSITATQEL